VSTFFRLFQGKAKYHGNARRVRLAVESLEERTVPTLLGQQLFPADNPWNQQITNAPVAANSAAVLNNIISKYGDGQLHPDFGQDYHNGNDLYGIPYNVVHGNSTAKVNVVIDAYASESDIQAVPLPANVVLEGDYQNGPKAGVNNRGDSHLLVYDLDNNVSYEFYRASRPSEHADGKWHADQETVWDMKTNIFRTLGDTSADAAGLSILAGLVRPDEALPVSQGGQGVINHAIRFTLQNSIILDQFLYPASHVANSNNNPAIDPPMGARFRLDPNVDISQLNPESRIIAQAMKDYGLILADNGSNFYFSGASYSVDGNNAFAQTYLDSDIQDSVHGLKSLKFSDFQMVDLTPVVTGLSAQSGAAGTTVTVIGQNFSGAAGNLQVLFGNAAATSVTVVDDSHVTVVVPNGTGTVDVRVQSGQTTPPDSQNVNNTIFGYGISAVNANDRFTYGGGSTGNQPPTVASAASASPAVVTGKTTNLSVLGADDGGESNLTYTWTATAKPTGASDPTFSANGTNAAKGVTATFSKAGSYTFQVTIRDSGGLTATSSVTVTVQQTLTSVVVSPGSVTVKPSSKTQFTATGYDQFAIALVQQPTFTWTLTGAGSLSSKGLYTAPRRTGGPYTITAKAGGVKGTATVRVATTANAKLLLLSSPLTTDLGGRI
jgi:hypothetical protein